MKRLVALSCLLGATLAAAPQDRTDEFITAEMKRQRIPGLSLAVVKNGTIVKAAGYGVADVARKIPAKPETVYKIASVSKQFIATAVMRLVQDGRLGVDDPIRTHLEGAPTSWSGITIRHLLTHTSGLAREAPGFDPRKSQSDADVIRTAYPVPLRFAPGDTWEYSNTGYFVLAEIITRVSGKPWPAFLDERVFKPSGMTTTYPTNTTVRLPHRAVGYADNDKWLVAADSRALRPSGAFLSTVLDLAKWDAVLNTARVLSDSTKRQMWTPVRLNDGTTSPHGFGWYLTPGPGPARVFHTGGMTGYRSGFARYLDAGVTIIVLMNLDDVDIESILGGLAAIHVPPSSPRRPGA